MCQAQLEDVKERIKKLWAELLGERAYIDQLKGRLNKAEALQMSRNIKMTN